MTIYTELIRSFGFTGNLRLPEETPLVLVTSEIGYWHMVGSCVATTKLH